MPQRQCRIPVNGGAVQPVAMRSLRCAHVQHPGCALTCKPPLHPGHLCAVARISLVKPDKARAIEDMIIMAARRGQIQEKVGWAGQLRRPVGWAWLGRQQLACERGG